MPDIINSYSSQPFNNGNNKVLDQKSIGVANGIASLDGSSKIPLINIPISLILQGLVLSSDPRLSDQRDPKPNSVNTSEIVNDAVTFVKMQNISSLKLLGRYSAGTGDVQEIELDATLVFDTLTNKLKVIGGSNNSVVGVSVSNLRAFEFPSGNSGTINIQAFNEPEKIVKLEPSNMELISNVNFLLPTVSNSDNGKILKISTLGLDYKGYAVNIFSGSTALVASISQTMHELLVKNGAWTPLI
jgi:hypothetical protein